MYIPMHPPADLVSHSLAWKFCSTEILVWEHFFRKSHSTFLKKWTSLEILFHIMLSLKIKLDCYDLKELHEEGFAKENMNVYVEGDYMNILATHKYN